MQTYHLIGIGGIGMGTLASLLLSKGHQVSGSDLKESEMTQKLRKQGAKIFIGHQTSHVEKPDCVVYSSAVRMNNPEMIEAVSRNIPALKRAQVLAQLVNEQCGITVAGAHGKTTTSSMISHILTEAKLNPTVAVGGIVKNMEHSANLGEGRYFVAEIDESDGTFLYFHPHISVITNMDFEHVDFYKNWDGIIDAYKKFIQCTVPEGHLIVCHEDERLRELAKAYRGQISTYGFDEMATTMASQVKPKGMGSVFDVRYRGQALGSFALLVPGRHNVLNALAAITVAMSLGIKPDIIQKALSTFGGVKRRFHINGEVDGVMIVDDYGHHPTEIQATMDAARLLSRQRLVVVFQPHRYSRTKFLLDEFAQVLSLADVLVLTDVYAASEKPSEGVGLEPLLEKVKALKSDDVSYLTKEAIVPALGQIVRPQDIVLFLGAGDIYLLADIFVKQLEEKGVVHG